MNTEKFKWCFIGAGRLAEKVAEEILSSGRHEIVSVYTRRIEAGNAFVKQYGGTAYETPEEAILAEDVDAVYVVTPHNSHYEYTKLALKLGKPVLCEKSFTVRAEETKELIVLAREKQIYLAEAMWTWFGEPARQAKQWIDSGELGSIIEAKLTYCVELASRKGRLTDPMRAGGALLDIGVYPVTYLYRLFGYPVKIECTGKVETGIDLSEEIILTFANGLRTVSFVSFVDNERGEVLFIKGEKGELNYENYHYSNDAKLYRADGTKEEFTGAMGYLNEFDLVAEEIREGLLESRFVPLQATLDVMQIMDECRRQMGLEYEC